MLRKGNPEAIYGGQMRPWQPCKSVPAPTSHTSTSQGWALHRKALAALAVPHRTSPGRRSNLTTLNLPLPCCKRTSLTGCFRLRLLWQEDHVLISICCTSTIHLHAHPQGKHSTHCANRTDPCRKAPAFSAPSDGAYRAYTLRRSWTWLICKVSAGTRLRTHGTFEIPLSRRHPVLFIPFWGFIVLIEANKFVYHWKLQKEEMTRHQVPIPSKKGSSGKRCLGSMPGHKMPLVSA